jgi:ribosomal protein L32
MFIRAIRYKILRAKRRHCQKANAKPPYTHCKNCGEELHGMYCSKCGQYASEANRPFVESVKLYLEHHYGLDHKLGSTLRYLFFKPGFLAREYMEGHIERHVHPFKLYFFSSILLFGVVLSSHGPSDKKEMAKENKPIIDTTSTGAFKINADSSINLRESALPKVKDSLKVKRALEEAGEKENKVKAKAATKKDKENGFTINVDDDGNVNSTSSRVMKNLTGVSQKELIGRFLHYLSISVLFLMPVFALLLLLAYRRKERYYTGHLVLSVHLHVMLFLSIALSLLWSRFISEKYPVGSWMLLAMMAYFVLSLSNFYQERIVKSLLKSMAVLFVYFIVCTFAVVGVVLLVLFH